MERYTAEMHEEYRKEQAAKARREREEQRERTEKLAARKRVDCRRRLRVRLRARVAEAQRRGAAQARPLRRRTGQGSRTPPHHLQPLREGFEPITATSILGAERRKALEQFEEAFSQLEGVSEEHLEALRRASTGSSLRPHFPGINDAVGQSHYLATALLGLAEAVAALQASKPKAAKK